MSASASRQTSVVSCTLYRCKSEATEPSVAAADGRCKHWTFGPDWICPFHADAGVEPFVMVPLNAILDALHDAPREMGLWGPASEYADHLAQRFGR